ncbi:hypothetical protein [Halorhabdus utahensis]|nr:hypothetical protein [Halorhabdus utahensis]
MSDRSRRAFRIAHDGRPGYRFSGQLDVATVSDTIIDVLREC